MLVFNLKLPSSTGAGAPVPMKELRGVYQIAVPIPTTLLFLDCSPFVSSFSLPPY